MRKYTPIILLFTCIIILSSCASTYIPIYSAQYVDTESQENEVTFDYEYDVLTLSENTNYTKRAERDGIQLVSIEVRNETDEAITLFQDFALMGNGKEIELIPPLETYELLRRNKSVFLWWMFLGLFTTTLETGVFAASVPLGLVGGVLFTASNFRKAGKSNDRLLKNLLENDLTGKVLNPGDQVAGLIAFKGSGQRKLALEKK